MKLTKYKTRALRTLSLLILVALVAALSPPSLTDSVTYAQDAGQPTVTLSASQANQVVVTWTEVAGASYHLLRWEETELWRQIGGTHTATSYTDTAVTAGKTYFYQVTTDVTNRPWNEKDWSNQPRVTVGAYDASTLDAPTASSTMMALGWSSVTGAASYELHRWETSEGWTQVGGSLTGISYNDTAVEIGKTYYYQVIAVGTAGRGAWSNQVSATVPSTTPGAPQNFVATAGDAQVTLAWDEPVSDGGSTITGYQYRYQMAGGSWENWMNTSPALSRTATVSPLTNETDYNFEVRAQNANGDGAVASDDAMPMSTVPGTPMGLASPSAGPTEIQLTWNAVDGATSYELQRRTNGGAWGSPMDVGSDLSYTDSGLTPSTTYDYEVRAVNAAGASPWSAVATVATTAPTVPDMPSLTATASADKIMLNWTAPAGNGAAITGYDVDVSDDDSNWNDLATPGAADTSYDHMNLAPGTMKYYRIRAMNSVGYSEWSASVMETVAAVVPGKPFLTAEKDGDDTITVSWTPPSDDGGAAITGYTLQVSNDGATGWSTRTSPAADATSYDHPGLQPGTTLYYRISARNSVGSGEWSDVDSATTSGAEAPTGETPDDTSPRNLRITPVVHTGSQRTTAGLTLNWEQPKDVADGVKTLHTTTPYEVEVWDGSRQAWGPVADDDDNGDRNIDTSDNNDPSNADLIDSGLKGVTKYTYRVRAMFDDDSKGKWSEQKSETTVAVSPAAPKLKATKMGTDKIELSWTLSDDGGSSITAYRLAFSATTFDETAATGSTSEFVPETTAATDVESGVWYIDLDPAQLSYEDENYLTGKTLRFYRVRAENGTDDATTTTVNEGQSTWSDVMSATTDAGVPGMPTIDRADGNDDGTVNAVVNTTPGQLTLNWTAPTSNGGEDIEFYEVQVWDEEDQEWSIVQEKVETTLSYEDSGLAGNTMRYYRVAAKNEVGTGKWAEVSGTTTAGVPEKPKLMAEANGATEIRLSWTVPANDGGNDITMYHIQMWTDADDDGVIDDNEWGELPEDPADTVIDSTGVTASMLTYVHEGLSAGMAVTYRVAAVNAEGATTSPVGTRWSDSATATTSAGVPGMPVLTVVNTVDVDGTPTAQSDKLRLTWVPPYEDATGGTPDRFDEEIDTVLDGGSTITSYDIAMYMDGAWSSLADNVNANPREYIHTGLTGMTTVYYSIRARNANGPGPWSEVESEMTISSAPGKPMLTAAPDGSDKIKLSWTVPNDGGSRITSYHIQVSNNGTTGWDGLVTTDTTTASPAGPGYTTVSDVTDLAYEHEDLDGMGFAGMSTRYYRVRAVNQVPTGTDNPGEWSDFKSATTPAGKPGTPTLTASDHTLTAGAASANAASDKIELSWNEPENGGSPIMHYQIQIWDNGSWMDLMTTTKTSYPHEDLPGNTIRYYRVRAKNSVDYGSWSVDSGSTTPGKPGAPMLDATANGSSEIRLTWTAPADGGSTIIGYELQVSDDGATGWSSTADATEERIVDGQRVQVEGPNKQDLTHKKLDAATTKYYRVRAINNVENNDAITKNERGPWSNVAMATTDAGAPGVPDAFKATANGRSMIDLTWKAPKKDGGSPISGYELQYWDGSNGWMALTMPAAGATSHTHMHLDAGSTKFYRIRAMNSGGRVVGNWATIMHATTDVAVPNTPSLMAEEDGSEKIVVSWTAGHDGGLPITKYSLQVSDDAGRTWANLTDVMDMTKSSYTQADLTGGMTKHYRIRAMNDEGYSGWSPVASATTEKGKPDKPELEAVGANKRAILDWSDPPTETGGSPILRYELEVWDSGMRKWTQIYSGGATSHTHTGLTNGKKYFYRVRAINALDEGDYSTFKYAKPMPRASN